MMELGLTRAPLRRYIGANAQMATAGFPCKAPASRGCAGWRLTSNSPHRSRVLRVTALRSRTPSTASRRT